MSLSFGLTASSALHELRDAASAFRHDGLNETRARDCAQKAWHLCELFFNERRTMAGFPKLKDFHDHVRQACPALKCLQEICIASKHGTITSFAPTIKDTTKLDGDFCREDFDIHDFNVPRLEITLVDGQKLLFDDVLDCAVSFLTQLFRKYGLT